MIIDNFRKKLAACLTRGGLLRIADNPNFWQKRTGNIYGIGITLLRKIRTTFRNHFTLKV